MSTAAHPDVEILAELVDGLLPTADAVAVRGHLAGCAACTADTAALRGALEQLAALLADEPAPTMPAEVAARLDALLAAEGPLAPTEVLRSEAAAPGPAPEPALEPAPTPVAALVGHPLPASVTTLPSARRRRPQGAWLGVAAASVLVLAGAGVFLGTQRSTEENATASVAAPAGPTVTATGTDYDPPLLDAAIPGLLGGGSLSAAAGSNGGAAAPARRQPDPTASSLSGTSTPRLQRGVIPAALARLQNDAALQGCLSELSGTATTKPLVLDYAAYQGAPALVVVLGGLSPDRVDVFVVGPGCAPRQADLLLYRSVPR